MTKTTDRVIGTVLSSLKSGSVNVTVQGEDPVKIQVSEGLLSVSMSEGSFSEIAFGGIRNRLTEMRFIRRLSEILRDSSMRLDLYADGRKILSMGKGVRSFLGSEKVYFSNLLRSAKH